MANIPNGILGSPNGKTGLVADYQRNGVRGAGITTKRKDTVKTPGRLAQREKIRLCNQFVHAFTGTGFFKRTFPAYGHSGSGLNRAMKSLMNLAITGAYPTLALSFPLVKISQGPLPAPSDTRISNGSHDQFLFSWSDNSTTGTAHPDDKAVLVAFFPEINQAVFSIGAAVRKDGNASLAFNRPGAYAAHTWMGFLNADESDASDSVWCGMVLL